MIFKGYMRIIYVKCKIIILLLRENTEWMIFLFPLSYVFTYFQDKLYGLSMISKLTS